MKLTDKIHVLQIDFEITLILLTSWTPPLTERNEIEKLISEGEEYMMRIDAVVKNCYRDNESNTLDFCKRTVDKLGLPRFLVSAFL